MTRVEAIDLAIDEHDCKYAEEFVDKIYNDHEVQLKAKDKEIERMKEKYNEILYSPYKKMAREELKSERKKTRYIVAISFWEWRKWQRRYKEEWITDRNKRALSLYSMASCTAENLFKKTYAMLKDNKCKN